MRRLLCAVFLSGLLAVVAYGLALGAAPKGSVGAVLGLGLGPDSGVLLGGTISGKWAAADRIARRLRGNEAYRVYNRLEAEEVVYGGPPMEGQGIYVEGNYLITLHPQPSVKEPLVAIRGSWDARPRPVHAPRTYQQVWRDAVRAVLVKHGVADPVVEITSATSADLDRDGVEEAVLTAAHSSSKDMWVDPRRGDYSLLMLYKPARRAPQSVVIAATYPGRADGGLDAGEMRRFHPPLVLDLNGDGRMEIVVPFDYYEGKGMAAHAVTGATSKHLFEATVGSGHDRRRGQVITALGPVAPAALGRVMMHEHLHSDVYDWDRGELVQEERPIAEERRALLMREAIPYLRQCKDYGCGAFVEATMPPWRAWPTFYAEASRATGLHIIVCTGFYREVEVGTYWVKTPEEAIWPLVRGASVEELAEFCVREIIEGIHGTEVCAGAIKLGSSAPELSEVEEKAFRAGARAQRATGVHITTHCTARGAETSQLRVLDEEGVNLHRAVIGHTASHLMDPECRKTVMGWMRRGASFMPTNLAIGNDAERWRPLIEAIHEVFGAGLGDRLVIGTDWAFVSESGPFGPCTFMPPPPYVQLFTSVLPAFRELGLTAEEEERVMATNPQRLLPVQ